MNSLKIWFERLTQNKSQIYIIPTKSGMKFLFINFLLFIIALSFANNMALIITFIMTSYFIIQMLEAHKIIQDLKFEGIQIHDQYYKKSQSLHCKYTVTNPELIKLQLHINFKAVQKRFETEYKRSHLLDTHSYDFFTGSDDLTRGQFQLERIKLYTYGGASLFYVWCYKNQNKKFFIYPAQEKLNQNKLLAKAKSEYLGELEYSEHKKYDIGHDSKRIDWKLFARTNSLYIKEYIFEDEECVVLNFSSISGEVEEKLRHLSYLIKNLYMANRKWKLILPHMVLEKSEGKHHFKESMEALSVY